jgi:hypothetical protein
MAAPDKIQLKFYIPAHHWFKKAYPLPSHLEGSEMWVGFETFPLRHAPGAKCAQSRAFLAA